MKTYVANNPVNITPSKKLYPSINKIALISAVVSRKILSSLNELTFIFLIGFFERRVVAIMSIIDNPSVIINTLLPNPAPRAIPYEPLEAAYATIAISGSVVAILSNVLPTNLAPNLIAKCSAPYESNQLESVNSPNQNSMIRK